MIILFILLSFFQSASMTAEPAEPQMTAPLATAGVTDLHDQFIESTDDAQKGKVLTALSRTPCRGTRDVQSLFDLFMRFSDTQVRDAVVRSVGLINFQSPDLDELVIHYLQQPEPEAQIFAIKCAVRIGDTKALPLIETIANRKFTFKSANDASMLTDKNAWWVQYEALAALAQWNGEKAMPLLLKKAGQAPEIARIMGRFLWKESLPTLLKWAQSSSEADLDRAHTGLSAPTPTPILRETREQMLAVVRDPKAPREARHQLALKVGVCSTHEEIEALVKEMQTLKTDEDRLMYKAAVFASRDDLAVPMLIQTVKEDPNSRNRAGALVQLKDMLPPAKLRPVLDWTFKNDPEPDNRDIAEHELRLLPR